MNDPRKKLLAASCFGGNLVEIKKLLKENDFCPEYINAAIKELASCATSALENQMAQENIKFLKRYLSSLNI